MELLDRVPLYPLLPLIFLAAATLFGLQMARHLRIFAAAQPGRPSPTTASRASTRSFRYAIVQVRMFRDPSAGLLHAAIFWGFIILTIGTADRVTFGLVHATLAWPLGGWLVAAHHRAPERDGAERPLRGQLGAGSPAHPSCGRAA